MVNVIIREAITYYCISVQIVVDGRDFMEGGVGFHVEDETELIIEGNVIHNDGSVSKKCLHRQFFFPGVETVTSAMSPDGILTFTVTEKVSFHR